ncbi:hypothetical protein F4553_006225 [Allocatelliglobosispora scoriae]|uniref:Uncharacterized protein n=1 Tax=Allocatelliglobosispora scoriae TaxID=643052 RepID=A0A841C1P6_9ACTN|nr:hypothetical protein [Allocatelliglobosispora scoriae]MBB5872791.1 hypothetical protein [Allocatelliglobosispora scoriae]
MGIDVQLRRSLRLRDSGEEELVAEVGDGAAVFAHLLMRAQGGGKTPILDRAYPYSDMIVVAADFPGLLGELAELRGLTTGADELGFIQRLEELTDRGLQQDGLELHFLGD